MFTPLPPRATAVDSCAASLRRAILAGELAPGERLPPERKLAELFAVNRVTVRSALARLAAEHLLRVRQGSGYLVRDYLDDGGPALLPGLAELASDRGALRPIVADLLLVRRQLARAVLERVAAGTDAAARQRFDDALDAFERAARGSASTEEVTRADVEVVRALLAATGSEVLQLCLNPVTAVLGQSAALRAALYAEPMKNVAGWRLLQAWLTAPDPKAIDGVVAAMAARDHETLQRLAREPGSNS